MGVKKNLLLSNGWRRRPQRPAHALASAGRYCLR